MGGNAARRQALDNTCRSRAQCDMPTSAACWNMTEVGSNMGMAWTPLRYMVVSPCLQTGRLKLNT